MLSHSVKEKVLLLLSAVVITCVMINVYVRSFQHIDSTHSLYQRENAMLRNKNTDKSLTNMSTSQTQCLTFDDEMENLISSSNQIFITMPAKAAGTSLKDFVSECMNFPNLPDNFLNDGIENDQKKLENYLTHDYEVSKVVASHLYSVYPFVNLAKHATQKTLLVYIYRNENDRLLSAIKEVVVRRTCSQESCNVVAEDVLIDIIKNQRGEIQYSVTKIMDNLFYQSIADNHPNLVFMHYKQASRLENTISKYLCPNVDLKRSNMGTAKPDSLVKLNNGTQVHLSDWLETKRDVLELTLHLKRDVESQGKTKALEETLLSCPDELIQPIYNKKLSWD